MGHPGHISTRPGGGRQTDGVIRVIRAIRVSPQTDGVIRVIRAIRVSEALGRAEAGRPTAWSVWQAGRGRRGRRESEGRGRRESEPARGQTKWSNCGQKGYSPAGPAGGSAAAWRRPAAAKGRSWWSNRGRIGSGQTMVHSGQTGWSNMVKNGRRSDGSVRPRGPEAPSRLRGIRVPLSEPPAAAGCAGRGRPGLRGDVTPAV